MTVVINRDRAGRTLIATAATALALAGVAGPAGAAPRAAAPAGTITTVAGGVGGPARATTVSLESCSVSFHGGSLYIADGPAVRKVAADDRLTTPGGTGVSFPQAASGVLATRANLETCGVTIDHSGNLVIVEQGQARIGVVAAKTGTFYGQAMTAGHLYTVAGNGKHGWGPSGAVATQVPLNEPEDVAVDPSGNLVISDSGFGLTTRTWARVQVVAASTGKFYGLEMTAGHLYTVAGGGPNQGASGDRGPATQAALKRFIGAITVDRAGNLVLADADYERIRVVATTSGTFYGQPMRADDIYTVAGDGDPGFTGDGGPATKAHLHDPVGVAVDAAGNLVVADTTNNRVRVVATASGTFYGRAMTAGDIYAIAGNGTSGFSGDRGPATKAELASPRSVAVDRATGNVFIADSFNGVVRVVAARTATFYRQAMTAGAIYTIAGVPNLRIPGFSGDRGPATRAELSNPGGVAVDRAGNMVLADTDNDRIRVVAATSDTFYGAPMKAGEIYTVAGHGLLAGFSGDGGPATKAELAFPSSVAVDRAGNLVTADTDNNRVRVVATQSGTFYGQAMTAGDIYTVAGNGTGGFSGDGSPATKAELSSPSAAAVDAAANLVISDQFNDRVRVVAGSTGTFYGHAMTAGDIYTIAGNGTEGFGGDGGPATSAKLDEPEGVRVDGAGNVLIADLFNERIRVVAGRTGTFYGRAMKVGRIYTVAGDGTAGFGGDGGPAASAALHWPYDVTVDGAGNLILADADNSRVRVVAARTGTFYGVPMTAGNIYTVAGTGVTGFTGDGGPGTGADLGFPTGLAVSHGNLLIVDNRRVRMLSG